MLEMYCDGCYKKVTITVNHACPVCKTDFFLHELTELDKANNEPWEYEMQPTPNK